MATITVVRPDHVPKARSIARAPRRTRGAADALHLTLIENGKPNARTLLGHVADELRSRLPLATVDVYSKPAAGKPIDADVADMLAARSHLVISGVGD
ncbi:MAG: hypothetical protein OXG55_01095 [bacterium]|nr:hypothetical protein [bacterium]MCY4101851.1 hypothetical protein [bacterium]